MNTKHEVFHDSKNNATVEIGTLEFEGREFSNMGAFVSDEYAVGYMSNDMRSVQTWSGEFLGHAKVISSWRINSYMSDRMFQVEVVIDDKRFTGRTLGEGMLWRGKVKRG